MVEANGSQVPEDRDDGQSGKDRLREHRKQESVLFWSERYRRPVNEAEVDEINRNLLAFFALLHQWDEDSLGREQLP